MTELTELRDQAIALRRAGKSRREIKEILQIRSNERLTEALRGEPPLLSNKRPNAKDDLRAKARELRDHGLAYKDIAAQLGVSKSSVSLWVRDLPRPERLSCGGGGRASSSVAAERNRLREAERNRLREAAREQVRSAAAAQVGELTDRDLFIAGVVAYWCEGTKNKPGRRRNDRVVFINSDPELIMLFIRFLDLVGVRRDALIYRVYIHESADVDAAQRYWLRLTDADPAEFRRPVLKRHRPATKRSNIGESYRGCLRIDVRCSTDLFRKIEGWARGILTA